MIMHYATRAFQQELQLCEPTRRVQMMSKKAPIQSSKRISSKSFQTLIGLLTRPIADGQADLLQRAIRLFFRERKTQSPSAPVSEAIGMQEAVSFRAGKPTKLKAYTDSSAARGLVTRRGVMGRVKHMATRLLWLQEVHAAGKCGIHPVSTIKFQLIWEPRV